MGLDSHQVTVMCRPICFFDSLETRSVDCLFVYLFVSNFACEPWLKVVFGSICLVDFWVSKYRRCYFCFLNKQRFFSIFIPIISYSWVYNAYSQQLPHVGSQSLFLMSLCLQFTVFVYLFIRYIRCIYIYIFFFCIF